MLKIAVASSDGANINEHFGQAKSFRIYEISEDGTYRLLEERRINPHCPGDRSTEHSAEATVEQLTDVNAVLVNRIGPAPTQALEGRGIRAFAVSGPIDRALASYGKRHKILDAGIPGVSQGLTTAGAPCSCSGRCGGKSEE